MTSAGDLRHLDAALVCLDEVRASLPAVLAGLAQSSARPPQPALLVQGDARAESVTRQIASGFTSLATLKERVASLQGLLERSRATHEADPAGIEPPTKRVRTSASAQRASMLRNRHTIAYEPTLDAPTSPDQLPAFLSHCTDRFPALALRLERPLELRLDLQGVLAARLALRLADGTLHVDRLVAFAPAEDVQLYAASSSPAFQHLTAAHDRPGSLEATLARFAALADLHTAPCARSGCGQLISAPPMSELPVVRVLRVEEGATARWEAFHRACSPV